ncbi:MAG: diguanylate cyclase, partial [Halothiobacillaceae bacterium]
SSMQRVGDLEQLKMEVSEALGQISKHMESYRFDEERRHQEADTRLAQLNERLQSLEHETATLRGRIREQRDQALRDALTGINNRLAYDERIEQEYGRWKRFREPISLLVWDVDHFKKINDTFGHQAGDKVLMAIAKLFVAQIREADFVARYGGEEFVVLATGATSATALILAEKLRQKIESSQFKHGDVLVPVTVSCGIAEFSEGLSVEEIFAEADRALYHAKQQGRNRCLRVEDLEA